MSRKFFLSLFFFVIGVVATVFILANPFDWHWVHGIQQQTLSTLRSSPGGTETGEKRKIEYWQAPMDPTFISDSPGKSPMGMDLIPVYEDQAEEVPAGMVRIDPVFVQNMWVQSVEIRRTDSPFTTRACGICY